jgi:sn-glycerol 3-phosphate transport system ATP-binding protein/multiple sugar transport system ATP-binding protein
MDVEPERFTDELKAGREVTVGVRPHDIRVTEGGAPFEVSIVEALGAESYAHGTIAGAPFVARVDAKTPLKKGDHLDIGFAEMHLFDKATGVSLRAP